MIKTQRTLLHGPSGQTRVAAVGNAKAFVLHAPRPDYPYEARQPKYHRERHRRDHCGSQQRLAVDAEMEQSIGNPILDHSAVSAFRRWRFKPERPGASGSRLLSC